MSALTDLFTSLANKIRNKLGTTSTYTPTQAISAIDDVYTKGVTDTKKGNATTGDVKSGVTFTSANGVELIGTFAAQTKTVTAGTSASTVTPDSGKYLSKLTINPTPSQSKSASPSTSAQTISPDSGKLLSSVSISAISTQEKTVTSSRSAQAVTPDSGKYLSKVTVNALVPAGTYDAGATRSTAIDMGATSNYRYVNTNSVANTNSGTYTPSSNGTALDMGATNTYRYVNTSTVYQLGITANKQANATKDVTLMAPSAGSWCLVLLPRTCGQVVINNVTYQAGSYVSGDIVHIRNIDGSNIANLALDSAQGKSGTALNLYALQVVLAPSSTNRQVYIQFTCYL